MRLGHQTDQGSQGKNEVLEVGQIVGAQGWYLGRPASLSHPPKRNRQLLHQVYGKKGCLIRVGTVGGTCMEAVGRCWTVPGSFPLYCFVPEIYF